MQGAVENHDLRPGQHGASQQDAHDMRWRQDFSRSPDVGFQTLWQRINVLFQFCKTKSQAHVAVGNIGSAQYNVVFDRTFEERQLRVDHEATGAVDGAPVDMAQIHADV